MFYLQLHVLNMMDPFSNRLLSGKNLRRTPRRLNFALLDCSSFFYPLPNQTSEPLNISEFIIYTFKRGPVLCSCSTENSEWAIETCFLMRSIVVSHPRRPMVLSYPLGIILCFPLKPKSTLFSGAP